jgi:transposase
LPPRRTRHPWSPPVFNAARRNRKTFIGTVHPWQATKMKVIYTKICDLAPRHFGADYSRTGMQGKLHRMKLSYLKPRPIHPKTDPVA